jgi:hypothetical protein
MAIENRSYVAGRYGLDLGGNPAGWLHSVEGGHATSDVVIEHMGPDHIRRKHLSGVKYEPITVACGTGMSKSFYDWIKDSFDHKYSRQDGAIICANYNLKEVSRLSFHQALISEVGFPALDAGSKDPCKMTIKFEPETTRQTMSPERGTTIKGSADATVKKKWLPTDFRLRIKGLDDACKQVNKIEALTVKQKNVSNAVGERRDSEREPADLEIPNLVFTTTESHADSLFKWHEDFVINGNNGSDHERSGTLEYLTPNLQEVLFTLHLHQLGIFRLTPVSQERGHESIRRVKAELYVDEMKFDFFKMAGA